MRNTACAVVVIILIVGFTGCAAQFGNERQYEDGDWYFFANSSEVAKIEQDKMALEKLEKSTPIIGEGQNGKGYRVYLANFSSFKRYTFRLDGPEKVNHMLSPEEVLEIYLIPGDYEVKTVHDGKVSSAGIMPVTAKRKRFNGVWCHGFAYEE